MTSYRYEVSVCDVVSKAELERYRTERTQWLEWLEGDPVHAITKQLYDMMWNDVTFRTFNEARRLGFSDNQTASISPLLAEFIDVGYVATQVLGISKLTETCDPNRPKRAVISVRRLVDEILANRQNIMRENFVAYDGLCYDFEQVKRRHFSAPVSGVVFRPRHGPDAWETSE
ncbi:MAG: hypothetical protein WD073_05745 [Xanthobacteraceae bacterium]